MSLTIGQRLRNAREYKLLSLEKASEATRIRVNYLQALETDDYSIIPSAAQGRGFLRNYAEFLGLNLDEIIAELQKDPPPLAEINGPLPHADDIPEPQVPVDSPTPVEVAPPVVEEKPVKRRGRKKKEAPPPEPAVVEPIEEVKVEAETQPVKVEQAEGPSEAPQEEPKPPLFSKVKSFLRVRKYSPPLPPEVEKKEEPKVEAAAPVPALPSETAEEIFVSIGAELRRQRELISLTFDEVERHTKVRAQFLKELEAGAFEKLPSPVQTRGMLTNYATFLDLDVDALLLRYADALQAQHRQKYPDKLRTKNLMDVAPSMPPLRSFIAGDLIFGLGMIAVLVGLAIWGVGRVMNSQEAEQAPLPTAPSISDVLAGTPQPTVVQEVTFIPVAGTQFRSITEEPTATFEPLDVNVQVIVTAVERAFIRVTVDGEEVFNGRVVPGDTLTYEAELQVSVLTGNGAALLIKYNGRDLGLMGDFGQVVSQVYSAGGLVTATPTPSPTSTPTPLVTETPTLTVTSTPTGSQTPTP